MRTIGSFGGITFCVGMKNGQPKVLSFDNMRWNTSINVEEHARFKAKPHLEVTGKNCDEITMDIYLNAELGVKPTKMLLKLRSYNMDGKVYPLKIGGKRIGSFKWIITGISNEVTSFHKNGKIVSLVASVTFKEYPYKKGNSKKKKIVASSASTSISTAASSVSTDKSDGLGISTLKKGNGYISYEVKKGDTLWSLAVEHYNDGTKYTKIYNANKIKQKGFHVITNPSYIEPGWIIKIPGKNEMLESGI